MKTLFLLIFTVLAVGCAASHPKTDIPNSPCACNYEGKPLSTPMSDEDKRDALNGMMS